jgi:hypothetical protein
MSILLFNMSPMAPPPCTMYMSAYVRAGRDAGHHSLLRTDLAISSVSSTGPRSAAPWPPLSTTQKTHPQGFYSIQLSSTMAEQRGPTSRHDPETPRGRRKSRGTVPMIILFCLGKDRRRHLTSSCRLAASATARLRRTRITPWKGLQAPQRQFDRLVCWLCCDHDTSMSAFPGIFIGIRFGRREDLGSCARGPTHHP